MSRSRRLKKYSVHVTKDYSGSDARQIPASGVTVTPYRRGFTVNEVVNPVGTNEDVTVFDVGDVKAGDTLQLASDLIAGAATPTVTVDSIQGPTLIRLDSASGSMVLAVDDRLVPTNNTPAAFDEPSGASSLGSFTTDAYGHARGYLEAEGNAVDVLISGGGVDSVMYYDEFLGGSESLTVYADDYATLQDAIDACESRAVLQLSSKQYTVSTKLTVSDHLTIRGEGRGENQFSGDDTHLGTTLYVDSINTTCIECTTDTIVLNVESLRIQGPGGSTAGTGKGIYMSASSNPNHLRCYDLLISGMGLHGIHLTKNDFPIIERVSCSLNNGDGIRCDSISTQVRLFHSYFLSNADFGVYFNNVLGFQIDGIGIQANHTNQTAKSNDGNPQLMLESTHDGSIQRIDFEDFDDATTQTAIVLRNCRGIVIAGNTFINAAATPEVGRGIYIRNNNDGICIQANRFDELDEGITFEDLSTTASHNIFIGPNAYNNDVTTAITLPSVANMADQNIVVLDTAGDSVAGVITNARGMHIPSFATGNLPTASGCEGSIAYDVTTQTVKWSNGTSWATI